MVKELLLEAPAGLERSEQGWWSGSLRLANMDFSGWHCVCRLEAPAGMGLALTFGDDGTGRLELPEGFSGALLATLELAEPEGGIRMIGAFQMHLSAPIAGANRRQITYRAIDSTGIGPPATVVDEKAMIRLPVLAERPSRSLSLEELLGQQRCLPLPDRGDGSARVTSVHAGTSAVLGRCYGSQLRGSARDYLDRLGERTIHWVTMWDDRWVNKLSARLCYHLNEGEQTLEVRNITDYSQARNDLHLSSNIRGELLVPAGGSIEIPLRSETSFTIAVGEGSHRRELVSCRFVEAHLGRVRLPLFKTERTRFQFPPESTDALQMCFLGVWLPLPVDRLERLLSLAERPLSVGFPAEAVYFWLRYRHGRELVTVTSNEDLRQGLGR